MQAKRAILSIHITLTSEGLVLLFVNECAYGGSMAADASYSLCVRQIVPGEAWLEDGTSRYFESPTAHERLSYGAVGSLSCIPPSGGRISPFRTA